MDPYEVEKFLYGLGLDGPGAKCSIGTELSFSGYPIEWGSDFRQANRLFQQICDLSDRQGDFKAWCSAQPTRPEGGKQEHCTVEDALKAGCNMRLIDFYPGAHDDETLGAHVLENYLLEEHWNLPDADYAALDHAEAGARFRALEGGVFVDGGYLVVGEDFADAEIPAVTPEPWIEVRFRYGELDTGWLNIPHTPEEEREAVRWMNHDSLDGLTMECRSLIPQLNGIAASADELPELRDLDKTLNQMSGEELLQYKALLELAQPGSASAALRLAEEKAFYYVVPGYADPAAYGRQSAERFYRLGDVTLTRFIDFEGYGKTMLGADGYESTRYGAVYRNAMAQKLLAGPNTLYRGEYYCDRTEGYPTLVCWDPDAQKVWLELSEGMADSSLRDNFAYYQEICEDWGVRHCATQEDYEQVIRGLGVQPYDQAVVPEEAQGFGGMGGMA
jgi:hypothetical protein